MSLSLRIPLALLAAMSLLFVACGEDECVPSTCSELGVECGTHDDGCGGTVDCGTCDSPPASTCDGNTAINYEAAGTCTADSSCEYTSIDEPCGTAECVVEGGVAFCETPAGTCDIDGFTSVSETAFADAQVLQMVATTAEAPPADELYVEWYFDFGAEFTGPGTYPVEQNTNYADCGLCVLIASYDADGNFTDMFFATEGAIEVTAVGAEGEAFTGELQNVVFTEWDPQADVPLADGRLWCVDGFTWDALLEGTLP